MTPEEIVAAATGGLLPEVEDVDPSDARLRNGYVAVAGRVAMPLDGVAWSLDRSGDVLVGDELDAPLAVLCLVAGRPPVPVTELTRYQYTALLADAPDASAVLGPTRFSRDYLVVEEVDFDRYVEHYRDGSALWGGFHHGVAPGETTGAVTELRARPGVAVPTGHHRDALRRLARSANPREQFMRTYQLLELLFDFVTYRRFVQAGDDLTGFGRIMSAYQRGELDRLKSIVREFCRDVDAVAVRLGAVEPFLASAEEMFQTHGKEGNPLKEDRRWTTFRTLVESGGIDRTKAVAVHLVKNSDLFEETVSALASYQVYRMRSSIAHSRIGEYLLTDADDAMIAGFGLPLVTELAEQVFSSPLLSDLMT